MHLEGEVITRGKAEYAFASEIIPNSTRMKPLNQ